MSQAAEYLGYWTMKSFCEMPKGFDIGWDHAIRIPGNKNETQYKYCDKILAGGGITRLEVHLGGRSKNVEKCLKCGKEIRDMFRQIIESGIEKRNEKNKAQEHYRAAMYAHPPGEDSDEDDYEFEMARQQSRDEYQRFCDEGSWDRRGPTKENTNVPQALAKAKVLCLSSPVRRALGIPSSLMLIR